jgi:hypothetical protein
MRTVCSSVACKRGCEAANLELQLTQVSQPGEQCAVQAGFEPRRRPDCGRQLLRVARHDASLNALDLQGPADTILVLR